MQLSIIIVSYRVKCFLEQCLCSVEKALRPIRHDAEILVVDNHSEDGSVEYLQPRFPHVRFIPLAENLGFSRANNLALAKSSGRYILFLNPDTILPEDAITICLDIMGSIPGIGAAGVRMIDGGGSFLRESRRGFPTPWVAFCKLIGLTSLFPTSEVFAGYYQGHLPEEKTGPAPILSGACMWVDKRALAKAGCFDEQFFMYAEDIDLSYRIEKAGFTNYYIADTTIIHFKGESTRKDARYIRLFYKAMAQFRRKHFRSFTSRIFNTFLELAVRLRIGLAENPKEQRGADQYDVILTASDELSYKAIIEQIQTIYKGKKVLVHAADSDSAVGSFSADGRGVCIPVSARPTR